MMKKFFTFYKLLFLLHFSGFGVHVGSEINTPGDRASFPTTPSTDWPDVSSAGVLLQSSQEKNRRGLSIEVVKLEVNGSQDFASRDPPTFTLEPWGNDRKSTGLADERWSNAVEPRQNYGWHNSTVSSSRTENFTLLYQNEQNSTISRLNNSLNSKISYSKPIDPPGGSFGISTLLTWSKLNRFFSQKLLSMFHKKRPLNPKYQQFPFKNGSLSDLLRLRRCCYEGFGGYGGYAGPGFGGGGYGGGYGYGFGRGPGAGYGGYGGYGGGGYMDGGFFHGGYKHRHKRQDCCCCCCPCCCCMCCFEEETTSTMSTTPTTPTTPTTAAMTTAADPRYRWYYDQLCAIEGKLPMTPTQIPISFKWKDAFDRGGLFASNSCLALTFGSYEKACIMFNIAALQSQIASSQKMDTDDELKLTAKLLMQSAGILNTLKDSVLSMVQQDPTSDLLPDTLMVLSVLMIAQAQEAIYWKAAKDEMKPALIAKVAAQAAGLYAEATRQFGREGLRLMWDKDWLPTINGKHLAFLALSQYYQALVCRDSKDTAEELARLTYASNCMQQAQQHLAGAHLNLLKAEATEIQKSYESAKKDNDFIYHEKIPDIKQLPSIQKAALAKPQPPGTQNLSHNFKDLFEKLTPISVQMAVARYDTRKSGLIQSETARLRENTNLMNTILASLNLPAALEDATSGEALPESIREKSAKVKSMGGISTLEHAINELPFLLKRNQEILSETRRLLDDEKNSDDQLRAQFKERWSRLESAKLTGPLYEELNKYAQILSKAQYADGVVKQKFDANHRGFELLSKTEIELKAAIPGLNSATGGSGDSPAVAQLKSLTNDVAKIKEERKKFENELKSKNFDMTTVFLRALAESGAIQNEDQLALDKLNEQYTSIREAIGQSIQRQEKLMSDVQAANDAFTREKGVGCGAERENVLRMLVSAYDAYLELSSNLEEGGKFYNDLTPLLVRLQQKVSDYCFARKTEKEDLIKDLQMTIISQPMGTTPSQPAYHGQSCDGGNNPQPPSRPPPPKIQTLQQHQNQVQHPVHTLQPNFGVQSQSFATYGSSQQQPSFGVGFAQNAGQSTASYPYGYSSKPPFNQQFSSTTPYPTSPMPTYPYAPQEHQFYNTMPAQQQGQTPAYPAQPHFNTWR